MINRVEHVPAVVVGSGVAGLSAALSLDGAVVLTKGPVETATASAWAQGGIAGALAAGDSPAAHRDDTLRVAAGMADTEAVDILTQSAPRRIEWLLNLGARFDRDSGGRLALTREAGHSVRRVAHSRDETGAEVMRTLRAAALDHPGLRLEQGTAVDLALADGAVVGVLTINDAGQRTLFLAPAVVLATGGAGRVYRYTTSPPGLNGDGIALAARAGATVVDLEFVQFHPTALATVDDPLPLLTEALRGEGARLLDGRGNYFMSREHPDAEMAPRDVVARAILRAQRETGAVFIDLRPIPGSIAELFPAAWRAAQAHGLDPSREPLPVTPAAHYTMGGVLVDHDGATSLPGLWACGEVTASGCHGANRLASNSLLEGLVYGARVAHGIKARGGSQSFAGEATLPVDSTAVQLKPVSAADQTIRQMMWDKVGPVREEAGLLSALASLGRIAPHTGGSLRTRNLVTVATLMARAALSRRESRGAHYRTDYPQTDPLQARRREFSQRAVPGRPVSVTGNDPRIAAAS